MANAKTNTKIDRRVYKNKNSLSIISRYIWDLEKTGNWEKEQLHELEEILLLIQKRSAEEALRSIQIKAEHYLQGYTHVEESFFNPITED